MSLRDRLNNELKQAMREKNTAKRDVIRSITAAIKEAEQEKREKLTKAALAKHNVTAPGGQGDADAMAAYGDAVDEAVAAENVDEKATLTDEEILEVIQRMIKRQRDALQEAEEAGRDDIVQEAQAEINLLSEFLPRQLTREEIEAEARAVIDEVGAEGPRDIGKVMGPLTNKLKGQAEGRVISEVVKDLLSE
ncbi:MAG: GatB/YqeY domain-containing protein [Chloroflexi bacterium]|nr:GatB/YqeY domain-containing protein [Chloroflexota bacterium]